MSRHGDYGHDCWEGCDGLGTWDEDGAEYHPTAEEMAQSMAEARAEAASWPDRRGGRYGSSGSRPAPRLGRPRRSKRLNAC